MNVHKNARLTPYRREELVARIAAGDGVARVAAAYGVSRQTVRKWGQRQAEGGIVDPHAWAQDRSSRPHHSPRTTAPAVQLGARRLRQQGWTCAQIAGAVQVSAATVARILRRGGLSRRDRLSPPSPIQRYEHGACGDLLHLDTKNSGGSPGPVIG